MAEEGKDVKEDLEEIKELPDDIGNKEEPKEELKADPLIEKATTMGWRPKEEYTGDPDAWVDAGEFVRRKPLFDEIHKHKREVKAIRETVSKFKEHHEKVKEAAYKEALESLKKEKLQALEASDHQRVVEIDDEIAARRANPPIREPEENPEFDAWVENNSWYMTDKELKSAADRAGKQFVQSNPDALKEEIYEYAESIVKKKFADRFAEKPKPNENRRRPSVVDNPSMQSRASSSGWDSLSEEAKSVGMEFVRDGIMTKEQYAKDLQMMEKQK